MFFAPAVHTRAFVPAARGFDRSFERFAADAFAPAAWNRVKVEQDEKSWTLSLDLPGVAREDLSIEVEDTVVRIATRAEAKRAFKAAYELPQDIDAEATRATLENGVLTLVLGKKLPVSNARRIEVK